MSVSDQTICPTPRRPIHHGLNAAAVVLLLTLFAGFAPPASAFEIYKHVSPHDHERPLRQSTTYVILHTTEGSEKGSLAKLTKNGEANFCVGLDGRIYKIISIQKTAYHAGLSMWNGQMDLDRCSIGIEVVGTYGTEIQPAQYKALKALLEYIQAMYNIPDEHVLSHSMVAYGAPNPWYKTNHRGRKRCGMLFARDAVRIKLGLTRRPALDPDVKAGRLVVGDAYLAAVLYGAPLPQVAAQPAEPEETKSGVIAKGKTPWDIAGDAYASSDTLYIFPDGTKKRGNQIKDWNRIPTGTRVQML